MMDKGEQPRAQQGDGTGKKRKRKTSDEIAAEKRIQRGPGISVKRIADKKLRGQLKHTETVFRQSQAKAIKVNEWLLPSDSGFLEAEGVERTWNYKQEDIVQVLDTGAARKAFDLSLTELGPYSLDFTRSGRYMLLGGQRGHLAMMDWQRSRLVCEVQVKETTRDVKFLHNETFFAAAQKKYVYIYDKRGIEIHCLRDQVEAHVLEFLPHHFLLSSIGEAGVLHYQDTSTGAIVAQHKTKMGPCSVMRQNPHNAVLCLGHSRGTVTMWSPNMTTPLVKMLCHQGPITALAVDAGGNYLVTAGADKQMKVWDVRTFKPVHSYFTYNTISRMDISQKGLLAVGYGRKIQLWQNALRQKQPSPYMTHHLASGVMQDFAFCPYEDVLGIGHSGGVSSILVPGAGEPNFDSYVANPFASKRERQEGEVAGLLDKLQPDTIMLDPDSIGRLLRVPKDVQEDRRAAEEAANAARLAAQRAKSEVKVKMKGKNKPSRRHKKKQGNIIEEKKPQVQARMKEQGDRKQAVVAKANEVPADVPRALHAFFK